MERKAGHPQQGNLARDEENLLSNLCKDESGLGDLPEGWMERVGSRFEGGGRIFTRSAYAVSRRLRNVRLVNDLERVENGNRIARR